MGTGQVAGVVGTSFRLSSTCANTATVAIRLKPVLAKQAALGKGTEVGVVRSSWKNEMVFQIRICIGTYQCIEDKPFILLTAFASTDVATGLRIDVETVRTEHVAVNRRAH